MTTADLVVMLLEGHQPHIATVANLLASSLPLTWSEQRRAPGVA